MVRYNYLKHNESDFPHVGNVDVYKFDNDFDYERFNATQMELQVCSVPWDVGEAHIGARTISGIGNVVYFETKEERDAWFDAIPDSECYRFTTKYKELHRDMVIDVPIPYDMCAKHNYLVVKYNLFANDDSPVMYEGADGLREWFWFIREVEFVAPNTTRLHLLDDAFQTWIYDINVSGMILERGHAPLFAMSADEYLSNPLENNAYLLTEDVNFGDATQVAHTDALVLNDGNMYACIATTGNPRADWGAKSDGSWHVPVSAYYANQGQPSCYVFAVSASNINSLLVAIDANAPQFKQTIQAIFFISEKLVTVAGTFELFGIQCYNINASRKTLDLTNLGKSQFGYDSRYADIAKLYTSPYAHIEISDENGEVDIIRIEDTTGSIDVSASLSYAWPFINLDAHLMGVGGSRSGNVTFRNVNAHTFPFSGRWYDTLRSWSIPTFAVVLSPAKENDYGTHFDRVQQVNDYTTAKANADASADTMKANADASADTMKANEDASADLVTDNALLTTTANTAITNISNGSASDTLDNTRDYNFQVMDTDNAVINTTATSTIQAAEEQAAVATASAAASGIVGAIASAATGNIAGAVSSAVNGIIGGASTIANTAIEINLTSAKANIATQSNEDHAELATDKTGQDTATQQATATSMTTAQNTLTSGTAANSSATQKANASRSQATTKANALRDQTTIKANAARDASNAQAAINNSISQAALREPFLYGDFSNGESASTKPMALFANIVTQSKSAIASAGDEFLRYGYMLDRQWEFDGDWNVGKYFTYWKLKDFWVYNLNVPDMYMDKIRFFLFGGVTVWRKPEYIGKVSVYDNLG